MADFFSRRFSKFVWLTSHAKASMLKRAISVDILICAAIFEADSLIVKTVMINWSLESEI